MATYYVAATGNGKGSVHNNLLDNQESMLRYELSHRDLNNLSKGFVHLGKVLFAAGAVKIFPCIQGLPYIDKEKDIVNWQEKLLPKSNLSLTTVHAFSSIPIGENRNLCAADSFGKIYGFENLYVNDASMLPESPGTNPQGTIMALARRNAMHFISTAK
jgi:choline dehydrogenase-like flavoprotein